MLTVLKPELRSCTAPTVPNGTSVPIFENLQIDREDVEREWPLADSRMPLVEMRKLAIRSGWPSDTNPATAPAVWIDFTDAIRQAGVDGSLRLFGRLEKSSFREIVGSEPLRAIPPEHWLTFKIDTMHFLRAEDNLDTVSYDQQNPRAGFHDVGRFRDIHIDRASALKWLAALPLPF
jgi:hypothetical protein